MSALQENFQFYLDNQEELVKRFGGRVLVIHNLEVTGDFGSNGEAYVFGVKTYGEGNFLIQRCSPGKKDYTAIYSSQAIFT